ncbi:MAG: reverse transcriptase-like protein [Moorella humiferrea]|nr:reverse transcriptase-like protein [Moorella humiferrea]
MKNNAKYATLYCDGSYLPRSGAAYGGYEARVDGQLTRRWKGQVKAADSLETEFQAVITALKWAVKNGYRHITVYTECQALVRMLRSGPRPGGKYARLVRRVAALAKLIGSVWFRWVPREKNRQADMLCRMAKEAL